MDRHQHLAPVFMLVILWLVGWTLRVPVLAAPPLATRIAESYGLDAIGIGAVTMLPVIAIAFGAVPAAWIIGRFGVNTAIASGIVLMAVMSATRGYMPSGTLLFAVSLVMGFGIAVFQTALPAATRLWAPGNVALGNAVYLNGMMVGEMSGAGLTLPLVLLLAGGDWRIALVLWSLPILLIALAVVLTRSSADQNLVTDRTSQAEGAATSLPGWNDMYVWRYGILLAGSVVVFFVINAFMGAIVTARNETGALAWLLLLYNATPLLASFVILASPNWIGLRAPIAASAALSVLGLLGFTFLTGWASWLGAVLAGFAASVELILLVSLPAAIAKGRAVTRLSAGMTLVGYGIAFGLPLIGGWLAKHIDRLEFALVPSLIFATIALLLSGKQREYPSYP